MLYIAYFIIVSGHNINKISLKILLPGQVHLAKNLRQATHTQNREQTDINAAYSMLYIPWLVTLSDHGIIKKMYENFDF